MQMSCNVNYSQVCECDICQSNNFKTCEGTIKLDNTLSKTKIETTKTTSDWYVISLVKIEDSDKEEVV